MAALADAPRGARSRCALHFHARRGDAGAITRLLRVADADVRDAAGDTPLHHACAAQGGHAAAVRALLRGGADANAENARALSPSVVAAAQPAGAGGRANAALVALLEAGACVNAELSAARPLSPLIKSIAAGGVVANAEALLDAGADVNASNHLKTSPLLMACSPAAAIADPRERLRLVELLLREGADVSARNVDGLSAVHLAAKLGDAAVLRVVLHAIRGADAVGADARAAAACNAAAASGCEQCAALSARALGAALSRALGARSRSLSPPARALSRTQSRPFTLRRSAATLVPRRCCWLRARASISATVTARRPLCSRSSLCSATAATWPRTRMGSRRRARRTARRKAARRRPRSTSASSR
jgi:ankyrin repeat protein